MMTAKAAEEASRSGKPTSNIDSSGGERRHQQLRHAEAMSCLLHPPPMFAIYLSLVALFAAFGLESCYRFALVLAIIL